MILFTQHIEQPQLGLGYEYPSQGGVSIYEA